MQNPLRLLLVAAGMTVATNASATDSWVIFASGEKPNREAWVVDAQQLSDKSDLMAFLATATPEETKAYNKVLLRRKPPKPGEVTVGPDLVYDIGVNRVFENGQKPNRVMGRYTVNCRRNTVAMKDSIVQWRDRPLQDVPPEQLDPRTEATEPWQVQMVRFVCLVGPDPKAAKLPEAMMQRGFLPIGDVGQSPVNFIWAHLWKDGTRPAFTYQTTDAELDKSISNLESNLAKGYSQSERVVDDFQRSANRVGRNTLMEMWVGKTEHEFVRNWGTPDRVEEGPNGSRTLYLHRGARIQGLNVYGHVISDVNNRCDITVFTVDGYIRDYATQGAACTQQVR